MDIDIDIPSHKRNKAFDELKKYYNSIGGDIVRVCTFGTETAKSAIQTACRGLKINGDVAMYLSSLIPVERGAVRDIKTCYYGNEADGVKPVTEFKNLVDEWSEKSGKNLLKVALGIEGLVNKRSSHACGAIITNEEFTNRNALMRTPSGELVTQFDLHDSEELGGIKYDLLNTKTASMIQITLELLLKNNKIQWQGSLRKTYDKYLHPDVIERDSEDMWKLLTDGMLISAFQYDSPVGEQAIKSIQPSNFIEAMNGNNLMRLMAEEGKQQPMDIYVRNKLDITKWDAEMSLNGLNEKEKQIIKKHLEQDYGVCSTQERMMLMSMDKDISGFNVVESNILRKGVAKKVGDIFEKAHKLFYEKGMENGARKEFLDYIWNIQIAMQRGYGFSVVHSVEYTWILAQQLNLIKYYPSIYWNTAVLLIESGAIDLEETENSDIKSKEKGTKYGAMASAISNLQDKGVIIALPDINNAEKGFIPNEDQNEIMFGLKGVTSVNSDIIDEIMKHRPFSSVDDFYKKMLLVKKEVVDTKGNLKQKSLASFTSLISLIKSGAFDSVIESREEELKKAILLKSPNKQKLEMRESTVDKIIELGIVPSNLKEYLRFYNFNKYIKSLPTVQDKKSKSVRWIKFDCGNDEDTEYTTNFLLENFAYDMQEGEDKGYYTDEYGFVNVAIGTSKIGSYNKAYNMKMKPFFDWYKSEDCLNIYNNHNFEILKEKYMSGNQSKWEMDSMNFYYGKHELWNLNKEFYEVEDFNSLSEEPNIIGFTKYNGMSYPKFELTRIAGTVLDRDKNRHTVTVLTPTGVVNVKFYSGQFSFYDKTVSIYDREKDKKITLEDGWFTRGTKLLITGFRRGDQFKPKKYKNSIYQHSLQKIEYIDENGMLSLTSDRVKGD